MDQLSEKPALKLLMISGTWPPMRCGVGDYTAMLCGQLAQLGVDVHVLTSRQARADLKSDGRQLLHIRPDIDDWTLGCLKTVRKAVRELKPDVINLQWPTAAYGRSPAINLLPVYLRMWFPRIPLVTTLHELRYFKPLTRLRTWPSLMLSRHMIIVDPLDVRVLRQSPVLGRCHLIPIGSNLPSVSKTFDRAARRRDLGFAPDDFVVGFFGFANPPKGLETLFEALAQLKPTHPNLRLLLLSQLSEQNAYERKLLQALDRLGIKSLTVSPEYAEPHLAAEILASADCAALPFTDGASVKRGSLIACLAQGLPIVTTTPARGEVSEFQDRVNMLLVPPQSAPALAEALEQLMQSSDLRARLALEGWDLARQFSWEDIARRQRDVFQLAVSK